MARSFDGVDDFISFGSGASINDFSLKSVLFFERFNAAAATDDFVTKSDGNALIPTGWQISGINNAPLSQGHLEFTQDFTTTDGTWITPNDSLSQGTQPHTVAVVYDRGATDNDPNIYINGTLQAETETSIPLGASNGDAAQTLHLGQDDGGNNVLDGVMAFFVYDDTLLTAADVNRHRWWGVAPGGPSTVSVWQPMWTDSLLNKGTATANGTALPAGAGPVMASLPRVKRIRGGG